MNPYSDYFDWAATSESERRALIERAIARFPRLTSYGLCVYDEPRLTREQVEEQFRQGRAKMFTQDALDAFARACAWLSRQERTQRINPSAGDSYLLKRCMDRDGFGYVTNGLLVAAAVACGFIVAHRKDTPNAYINVSKRVRSSRRHGSRRPYPSGAQPALTQEEFASEPD